MITFGRLERISFTHSVIYLALLTAWLGFHNPQPETLVLGYTHGVIWIGNSLLSITAARLRIIPLRVAVAVAVLGGIAPFFGSAEYIREGRRRARTDAAAAAANAG